MPFDYHTINLNALAELPKTCKCEDKAKDQAMRNYLLGLIQLGNVGRILVHGIAFRLVREESVNETKPGSR